MFFLDYDGYGEGEEWQDRKKNRYYRYKLKDIMLGAELNLPHGTWLRNVVFEYLYTKYQSGPFNHDHTMNIPDHRQEWTTIIITATIRAGSIGDR